MQTTTYTGSNRHSPAALLRLSCLNLCISCWLQNEWSQRVREENPPLNFAATRPHLQHYFPKAQFSWSTLKCAGRILTPIHSLDHFEKICFQDGGQNKAKTYFNLAGLLWTYSKSEKGDHSLCWWWCSVLDLVASCGEVVDCDQLNTPHPALPYSGHKRRCRESVFGCLFCCRNVVVQQGGLCGRGPTLSADIKSSF